MQVFSRSECDRMLVREEKRAAALKRDAYQVPLNPIEWQFERRQPGAV